MSDRRLMGRLPGPANLWLFAGIAVVVAVVLIAARAYINPAPYDPLVLPTQTVEEVAATEVVIAGALCNTDDEIVSGSVTLQFTPEMRGRPVVPILVESVQDYLPGCEVHHVACSEPGDNGTCPSSVCQNRIPDLPANVSSCHPAFVNTFTDDLLAQAEESPLWRVAGTITPVSPRTGETVALQSEVFRVEP